MSIVSISATTEDLIVRRGCSSNHTERAKTERFFGVFLSGLFPQDPVGLEKACALFAHRVVVTPPTRQPMGRVADMMLRFMSANTLSDYRELAVVCASLTAHDLECVTARDVHGSTLLHYAAYRGCLDAVVCVLSHFDYVMQKCITNTLDGVGGCTPLCYAALCDDWPIVLHLMARGASPLMGAPRGISPIQCAAAVGAHRVLQLFLTQFHVLEAIEAWIQRCITCPDRFVPASPFVVGPGLTILHWAVYSGNPDMVFELVTRFPALVGLRTDAGQLPMDLAGSPAMQAALSYAG